MCKKFSNYCKPLQRERRIDLLFWNSHPLSVFVFFFFYTWRKKPTEKHSLNKKMIKIYRPMWNKAGLSQQCVSYFINSLEKALSFLHVYFFIWYDKTLLKGCICCDVGYLYIRQFFPSVGKNKTHRDTLKFYHSRCR